jgi:hypothetical protein
VKKISILLLLAPLFFSLGCKKDHDSINPKTLEQVLVSTTWKMEEIRFLQNNTFYYYKRGASGNSLNFDSDAITFKQDKTGSYVGAGVTYTLTWDFTDTNKNRIRLIVNYPSPLTINWENITYTTSSLKYSEYYTSSSGNTLSSVTRTPL